MSRKLLPIGALVVALLGTSAAFAQNTMDTDGNGMSDNSTSDLSTTDSNTATGAGDNQTASPQNTQTSSTSGSAIPAENANVVRATLKNGLQIVVVPDHLAPVSTTMVTYKVGSREAPKGFPGMAHAQEHMMFRGTKNISAAQIMAISAALGGDVDAFTTNDNTSFYFTMPSQFTNVALRLQAARMKSVLDSEKDWKQERGAIEQEVSRDMSSTVEVAKKRLREQLYGGTPYSHDALGTRASFNKTTAKQLKSFHDKWYAPNNATLVVTGDVDPKTIIATVRNLFGGIPSKKLPERPPIKPGKIDRKTIRLPTDAGFGFAVLGFRAPGSRDVADFATAQVLGSVLNNPRGPLYTDMVASGKSLAARFTMMPAAQGSLGFSYVVFPKGADASALVKQMRSILGNIAKNGIKADQIAAAKRSLITQDVAARDSIHGLALRWSQAVAVDGLSSPTDELQAIENVTPAEVNKLLAKVIQPKQSVLAVLTPQGSGAPSSGGGYGGAESFAPNNASNVQLPKWAAQPLAKIVTPKPSISPVESKLANGMQLITVQSKSIQAVHVYGLIRSDSDIEQPKKQDGVAGLTSDMLDFGTQKHGRKAYQAALDAIGASTSTGTSFSLTVLPDHFDRGMALLAENELAPALPKAVFKPLAEREAATQAGVIASPSFKANLIMNRALLPKGDPALRYATPASIRGLTYNDVPAYFHKVFRPDLTTLVVVSPLSHAAVEKAVKASFGSWKNDGPTPKVEKPPVPNNGPSQHHVPDSSQSQDSVDLAEQIGLTVDNNDFYALKMANQVLTGGLFANRLFRELRVKRGLVYTVGSGFSLSRTRDRFELYYGSDPSKANEASQLIEKALVRMENQPISQQELHRARAGLIRAIPLGEASADAIGNGLLRQVSLGLPLDEPFVAAAAYQSLDPKAIQAAFKKWIRPHDLVRVVQGPAPK